MPPEVVQAIARQIVDQLVRGDYESFVGRAVKSRLTSDDLRRIIGGYGRKVMSPPSNAYRTLDAVQVESADVPTWLVRAPLWTEEEGRSDLTVELTIALQPGTPRVELDDLHVL